MSRTIVDLDDAALALAQQQLGTRTKRDTINKALMIAAGTSADERERAWAWLQENAESVLDFDVLEANERSGR
jgi:Arc/MetJ family transcription regulator